MLLSFVKEIKNSHRAPVREQSEELASNGQSTVDKNQAVKIEKAMERFRGLKQISDESIETGAQSMFELADQIEAKGTKVIFFEMPGESLVRSSRYYQLLRAQLGEPIGPSSVAKTHLNRRLHRLDIGSVNTADGIHLDSSALNLVPHELFSLISANGIVVGL